MILKGESHINITHGNSLIPHIESIEDNGDQHTGKHFYYLISNPLFGVNWSDYKDDALKFAASRYQWGTPDISDGAFLVIWDSGKYRYGSIRTNKNIASTSS